MKMNVRDEILKIGVNSGGKTVFKCGPVIQTTTGYAFIIKQFGLVTTEAEWNEIHNGAYYYMKNLFENGGVCILAPLNDGLVKIDFEFLGAINTTDILFVERTIGATPEDDNRYNIAMVCDDLSEIHSDIPEGTIGLYINVKKIGE